MAQIAEDLLLLLLDNASAQPGLDRARRNRVLTAAVLLDLAYAGRIRPAVDGEPIEPGRLVALSAPGPVDPVGAAAYDVLARQPLAPSTAIRRLRRHLPDDLVRHLEQTGHIRRIPLRSNGLGKAYAWPLTHRDRVTHARAALLATLFEHRPPAPATAAIVSLLHAVDGLGALLSLNDRGWRWVHARAGEIASGSWLDEFAAPTPADLNLAITASALRQALR